MDSVKCHSCGRWIGAMELHADCKKKQERQESLNTAAAIRYMCGDSMFDEFEAAQTRWQD